MVLPLFSGRFASCIAAHTAGAGRDPYQNPFLFTDLLTHRKRVFVLNGDDLIIDLCVQYIRNKSGSNALNLMAACRTLAQHR